MSLTLLEQLQVKKNILVIRWWWFESDIATGEIKDKRILYWISLYY